MLNNNDKCAWIHIETGTTANPRITWSMRELTAWARNWTLDTLSPDTPFAFRASDFHRRPSTYANNKFAVEKIAHLWSSWMCENSISYGEIAAVEHILSTLGRRYGLLTEFRENGLC